MTTRQSFRQISESRGLKKRSCYQKLRGMWILLWKQSLILLMSLILF